MATGTITTLGVGSGLQLQSILDQLKAVDQQVITNEQTQITSAQSQLNELTTVNNKLLTLKGAALNLSLSSTFLGRTITSSSPSVATATVSDGATVQNSTLNVTNLAQQSSWMSATGAASSDSIVYVPTSQVSSGVANPATTPVAAGPGQLTITFGGSSTITVNVDSSTMMDDGGTSGLSLVSLINNSPQNAGKVVASTSSSGGQTYLQIATATPGGTGEANRVAITTNGTSLTFAPPAKTLTIQSGTGTTSLSVAADTTLSQLATQINTASSNPGITAAIVNDGVDPNNPYKLAITANSTGESHRISFLSQLPDLTMTQQASQTAANSLNAQFTVNGVSYQRQGNTVNDVLSGVTFNLQGNGTTTLGVASDNSGLGGMITSLVTAYNDVVQEVTSKSGYDTTTSTFGVLASTTSRDLPSELENLMTTTNSADPTGAVKSMFDLGLTFNRDGSITIDSNTLNAALSAHPDAVQAFFLGNSTKGITGFADTVNNQLLTLTSDSGSVAGDKNAAQARIDNLNQQIANDTDRLNKKYDQMTQQFVALDSYMHQMTSMSNFLTGQFNSLSNGWSGTGSSSSSSSSSSGF